jgi:hypothetical protein
MKPPGTPTSTDKGDGGATGRVLEVPLVQTSAKETPTETRALQMFHRNCRCPRPPRGADVHRKPFSVKTRKGKWCCHCQAWRPLDEFRPRSAYSDGVESWCRPCHAEQNRQWRERNPEYVAAYNASRRLGPRERECVDCGSAFTAGLRGPASDRCPDCRRQRKVEQRRTLRLAQERRCSSGTKAAAAVRV